MKALVAHAAGRGTAGLALQDADMPSLNKDEVLIRVAAVSASHLDMSLLDGQFGGAALPRTIGIDPVGVIVDAGAGVPRTRVGAAAVVKPNLFCGQCDYCRAGREADCLAQRILGIHVDGGAAEYVAVPSRSAFTLPQGLAPVNACATVHTAAVAMHMLRTVGGERDDLSGQTVLVTGAAGAVGSATVQLAKAFRAARVIGAIRGVERAARVTSAGADAIVDVAAPDATVALRDIAPDGVSIAVEATGQVAVAQWAFEQLGWAGKFVTCAGRNSTIDVNVGDLYRQRQSIHGTAGSNATDITDSLALAAERTFSPAIDRVVDLVDYESGYQALRSGESRVGRVVFDVDLALR